MLTYVYGYIWKCSCYSNIFSEWAVSLATILYTENHMHQKHLDSDDLPELSWPEAKFLVPDWVI